VRRRKGGKKRSAVKGKSDESGRRLFVVENESTNLIIREMKEVPTKMTIQATAVPNINSNTTIHRRDTGRRL
jgi:hypothetical protein